MAQQMPKTIIELVTEKSNKLLRLREPKPGDPPVDPPVTEEEREALFKEAEALAALATRAIIEGRFSLAWRQYMSQFVYQADATISAKQLSRLLADDGTITDDAMNRRRAYLLGNAICGGPSPDQGAMLDFGVDGIDNNI